jgi:signal transduction histidine kinase
MSQHLEPETAGGLRARNLELEEQLAEGNGEGFEPAYAASVFEPFKRLHGKDVPGSGIGLATCKRVIERLGGRIWPESVRGTGSTFYFTLPAEKDVL